MLVANVLAGTVFGPLTPELLSAWGIGVDPVRDGQIARFVTAIFLSHGPSMLIRQFIFAATVIGTVEWLWGSWRAMALFFGIDISATTILLSCIALVPQLAGSEHINDVGMSMGGFGLIGVLLATSRVRWIGLAVVSLGVGVKYALVPEPLADGGHIIALWVGACVGQVWSRRAALAVGLRP
ncbi:hypothetical protein GQA70_19850 (plasmid) [Ponticoccus alexandrii]|uniref:Peptidase S54 rhomboid domain-containing protein n=2 Tax=Ponticoccus alexandrii TaxID=1943633 RepID=A0ABX7FDN8_9RHOB|nr:hypothetical protein GQA70_19850 [Ponticoccus alexandrii]